jgi:hypothetical protein
VIGLAFVCACIGFAVGFVATLKLTAWDWDRTYFGANSHLLMMAGLFGGSVGWFVGAGIGWFGSRSASHPSYQEARGLRSWAAVPAVIAVLGLLWSTASEDPEAVVGRAMIPTGAALVAVTLVILGQRGRFRQTGVAIGAIVAIAILVGAGMRFSSFLPFDDAWLEGWRLGQADAESFAPNLLVPAPRECPDVPQDVGDRFDSFGQGTGHAQPVWLEGHVPRWLPEGFGLLAWYRRSGGTGGVWVDEGCRQVRLVLFEGKPEALRWSRFPVVDRVGDWTVSSGSCPGVQVAKSPCLEYVAWSPEEPGESEGEVLGLVLQTLGIDRDVSDRIALGISVTGQDQG